MFSLKFPGNALKVFLHRGFKKMILNSIVLFSSALIRVLFEIRETNFTKLNIQMMQKTHNKEIATPHDL